MKSLPIVFRVGFWISKTYIKKKTAPSSVPTAAELSRSQQTDTFCQLAAGYIEIAARFTINDQRLVCRKALIDWALQLIVLKRLRPVVRYFCHPPVLAEHPGMRRIYNNPG